MRSTVPAAVARALLASGALLALSSCGSSGSAPPTPGSTWTFAVIGDTRDVTKGTQTGVAADLAAIAQGIAADRPDFVIHAGDLTNGYWIDSSSPFHAMPGSTGYAAMYASYKAVMKPVSDLGIPTYVVRGNHEFGGEVAPGTGVAALIQAYDAAFGSAMPQNGPANARGYTYSFVHRSANFIVTDQYVGSQGTDVNVDTAWIASALAANTSTVLFTLGHSPAYGVTGSSGETEFQFSRDPVQRDAMWTASTTAGVAAYISSHEHFYTRGQAGGIWQIVQGNGGATPFDFVPADVDLALSSVFPRTAVPSADMKPGYLLVTVDDTTGKISAVEKVISGGSWTTFDSLTIR